MDAGPLGVYCAPAGTDTDSPVPASNAAEPAPWHAEPALTALAEHLSGQPATVQTVGHRLLAATQGAWDLAQFDLRQSAGVRQGQMLLQGLRALAFGPSWRGVRLGLMVPTGHVSPQAWLLSLEAIPVVLLQTAWMKRHPPQLKPDHVRRVVCGLLALVGAGLVMPAVQRAWQWL